MKSDPTILVVDDDEFMRELLHEIFLHAGIAVQTFDSGRDLLARAQLRARCALLLDVRMPDMSGPQLHEVLREMGVDAPVIFLTAEGDVPTAVAAMRAGAADFIEKPFDNATLVERVRRSVERHETARAVRSAPDAALTSRANSLTPREHEVLELMVTGATSKVMARQLGGSFRTIEAHRSRVMAKMGAASLAELVRMNIELDGVRTEPPSPG